MLRKFGDSFFWIQHVQIRLNDISEHFYQKMHSHVAFCVIYTRLGLNRIIKRKIKGKNKEESADPEDPDDDVPLVSLVTALQPHFAEPMTTHEFIDEDVDLACQDR